MRITVCFIALAISLLILVGAGWYNGLADWLKIGIWLGAACLAAFQPRYGILFTLLILPTSHLINVLFSYPGFSFIEFSVWGLVAGASIYYLRKKSSFSLRQTDVAALGFWMLCTLSMVWVLAHLPVVSWSYWFDIIRAGLRDLLFGYPQGSTLFPLRQWALFSAGMLLYFILRRELEREENQQFIFRSLHISTIVFLLLSVVAIFFIPESAKTRFSGVFADTNQFAAIIIMFICSYAVLLVLVKEMMNIFQIVSMLLIMVLMAMYTFTKLLPFTLMVMLIFIIILFNVKSVYKYLPLRIWNKYLRALLLFLLIAGFLFFVAAQFVDVDKLDVEEYSDDLTKNFVNYLQVGNIEGLSHYLEHRRFPHWLSSAAMMSDYPLSGTGSGRYYQLKALYTPRLGGWYFSVPHENSHSSYLQIGAELGWLGLIIFIALPVSALCVGMAGYKPSEGGWRHRVLLAAIVGLIALLFNFVTTDNFIVPEIHIWFWMMMALVVGLGKQSSKGIITISAVASGLLILIFISALVFTPVLQLQGVSDQAGLHEIEQSETFGEFRWSDRVAVWRQRIEGRRMFLLLEAERPEEVDKKIATEFRAGSALLSTSDLARGESLPLQIIVAHGEGGDGLFNCGLLAELTFSPFASGLSMDGRNLGVILHGPWWDQSGLRRLRNRVGDVKGFYDVEQSMEDERDLLWFADEAFILIDGRARQLSLRILIDHPDVSETPVTVTAVANGRQVKSIKVTRQQWLTLTLPLAVEQDDTVISLRVDRVMIPGELGISEDSRALGFMLDLDSITN